MDDLVQSYYKNNTIIHSPLFGNIKITPQSVWHLYNKDSKHKRSEKEIQIRLRLFLLIDRIITKSHLFQEYKSENERVAVKQNGIKCFENRWVNYYAFTGIIDSDICKMTRIKVVIKQVVWWNHAEFVSVIPAWNMKGYNKLYFDENL